MRLSLSAFAFLASGCAVIHGLGDYSFADGPEDNGSSSSQTSSPSNDDAKVQCIENIECGGSAVCADGGCVALRTASCSHIVGEPVTDDSIVIGALLRNGNGSETEALESAAFLAAAEINASKAMRPLVVVGCDAANDVLGSTRHLVDRLHVPAIVGPTAGEDVVNVTQQVSARGGTLIMTPTSAVSSISKLADEGLTWRAVPSDAQRAKLVIEQMKDLETLLRSTRSLTNVKLGVVHASDARGESAYEAIRAKLILNTRFITDPSNAESVSVDTYPPGSSPQAIAAKYASTFRADLVFVTAAEQVTGFIVPLEAELTAQRILNRPYYVVTEAAKTEALLEAIKTLPADVRRRLRGVGVRPDSSSAPVLADFSEAYAAHYGAAPALSVATAAAVSYDAMYAIAYAMAANKDQPLTGGRVAEGLRTLGIGDAAAVGAKEARNVMLQLEARKSVSLRGTFAPMQWDASGDLTAGTVEVWCVGNKDGVPAFGASGLTMDVQTQVVGGAFVQCQ